MKKYVDVFTYICKLFERMKFGMINFKITGSIRSMDVSKIRSESKKNRALSAYFCDIQLSNRKLFGVLHFVREFV